MDTAWRLSSPKRLINRSLRPADPVRTRLRRRDGRVRLVARTITVGRYENGLNGALFAVLAVLSERRPHCRRTRSRPERSTGEQALPTTGWSSDPRGTWTRSFTFFTVASNVIFVTFVTLKIGTTTTTTNGLAITVLLTLSISFDVVFKRFSKV